MKVQKSIIMPAADHTPLDRLIAFAGKVFNHVGGELQARESELERRQIIVPEEISADAITPTSYAVHQTE
jgi:hypothetical protein